MRAATTALTTGCVFAAAAALLMTSCTYESEKLDRAYTAASTKPFQLPTVTADKTLTAQLPETIRNRGTLIVGSNTEYPPAEFLDASGQATGYDIDIISAVARKLGLRPDIKSAEFTGILPALGPKYDVGISSFTITAERLKNVNMVSFLNVGTTWAVQSGNPQKISLNDVCGLSVGVQIGTTQEDPDLSTRNAHCQAAGKPAIQVLTLKAQTDITTRLINGSIAAMAADSPITGYAITQTSGKIEPLGQTYNQSPQGIAVAKNDPALADLIKQALDKLREDGSYQKILAAWGAENSAVNSFHINPEVN